MAQQHREVIDPGNYKIFGNFGMQIRVSDWDSKVRKEARVRS